MGGGKKKSGKKSSGEHRKGGAGEQAAPPPSAPAEKDEAALALEAAVASYSRPVDALSAHLSLLPLKENELCRKFDIFISSETSMPEVGIQSARDLFVEVSKQQQAVLCRYDVLRAQKELLLLENRKLRGDAAAAAEDTQKGLHQKEVLAALADELTKQKSALLESCQNEANEEGAERQKVSQRYMKAINELSSKLEAQSALRIKEAERSESLKESMRKRLQAYAKAEEDFNAKMTEFEAALEAAKATKQYETEAPDGKTDEEKKKRRKNKKKKGGSKEGAASAAAEAAEEEPPALAVDAQPEEKPDEPSGQSVVLSPEEEEKLREEREEEAFKRALEKESARTEASRLHILDLVASEKKIRAQLSEYADRFERFQDALNKSNELFGGFKLRLEEMAGTIHSLEKQNRTLADKEKKSEGVLAGLKQEHAAQLADIGKNEQQIIQLGSLVSKLELDIMNKQKELEAEESRADEVAGGGEAASSISAENKGNALAV